jgi:exonuclease VII small subunit
MYSGHPYARTVMGAGAGFSGPPFGAPAMPPAPQWDAFHGDPANARRVVDTMLGTSQPLTLEDSFGAVFARLSKDRANVDLIAELQSLKERVEQRLTEQRHARMSALQVEHEGVYEKCRAKLDEKTGLINELGRFESLANAVGEKLSRYRMAAMAAQGRQPPDETFPTRQELEAWRAEVNAARVALGKVEREYSDAVALVGETDQQIRRADKELELLMGEEARLKAQAEGRPWRTPLGLEVPAEAE